MKKQILEPELIKWAKEKERSVFEIAEKFNIEKINIAVLRKRLKTLKIKTKDTRGRKPIEI